MGTVKAKIKKIGKNLHIEQTAVILAKKMEIGSNVKIGSDVNIEANSLFIGDNTEISDNVEITADRVYIGYGGKINEQVKLGKDEITPDSEIYLGDQIVLNAKIRASVPSLRVGDYGNMHEQIVFYGDKKCTIGHNCWIGQWSVFNSKDELLIGNNFRMGVQSQVWTHVASGELIEGCKMYKVAPTIIKDDVWFVGHVIISPGITIARKTIVLPGSVLTKDTVEGHCYAGVPAKDITDKYDPYQNVSIEDKFNMMSSWINEFLEIHPEYRDNIKIVKKIEDLDSVPPGTVVFTVGIDTIVHKNKGKTIHGTIFDLSTKNYTKTRSAVEIDIIKFLHGHKARFTPMEDDQ